MSEASKLLSKFENDEVFSSLKGKTVSTSEALKVVNRFKTLLKKSVASEDDKVNSSNLDELINTLTFSVTKKLGDVDCKVALFDYSDNDQYAATDKLRKLFSGKYSLEGTGNTGFHNAARENIGKTYSLVANVYVSDTSVICEGPGGLIVFYK